MQKKKKAAARKSQISNEDVLRILIQEIADVRLELKQDIAAVDGKVDKLEKGLGLLRSEVHQNHISFIKYQGDLDRRVTRVEAKVG